MTSGRLFSLCCSFTQIHQTKRKKHKQLGSAAATLQSSLCQHIISAWQFSSWTIRLSRARSAAVCVFVLHDGCWCGAVSRRRRNLCLWVRELGHSLAWQQSSVTVTWCRYYFNTPWLSVSSAAAFRASECVSLQSKHVYSAAASHSANMAAAQTSPSPPALSEPPSSRKLLHGK